MGALLGRPHSVQAGPGDRRAVPIGGGGVLTGSGDAHGSENRHEHLLGRRHVVVGRGPGSLGSTIALVLDDSAHPALLPTGIRYFPIAHDACSQRSEEEAAAVREILESLLGSMGSFVGGKTRQDDLTLVAVRAL